MGYERKKLQIAGGGFNCLPPPDKVPITDALLLQNWRSDSAGKYASRQGYVGLFSIPGAGLAHSAANMGGVASPYYVGCNSTINAPASALYYNGNPAAIASGFDGNRIGFASQNGFMYVMNRGNQGRHSAAGGWEAWNLAPPPASPGVAPATSTPVPVTTVTFTFPVNPNPEFIHSLTIAGVVYGWQEGAAQGRNALVASLLAQSDPNAAVTYVGTGNDVVITPIIPNILIPVSGSDGNPNTNLATDPDAITSLPNGTYQVYITFQSADLTLESNASPASASITVDAQAIEVTIPAADAPTDPRVGFVNIYATGGTLGQAYRVGQVASTVAAPATSFLYTIPDDQATNNGIVMPIANDRPPAARGIIGPHFSRLYAWSTAIAKNRLFYTPADQPQYWPGSADPQTGNWVDVGLEDEEIVWCSIHGNVLVLYKERTIWMLIGTDPTTASLEQVYDGAGLANAFALAPAGLIDYFVGPNGLQLFDLNKVQMIAGDILPLFNQSITNDGALTAPGSVLPGAAFNSTSTACYAIALGHALGRLYITYAEKSTSGVVLSGSGSGSNVGATHYYNWESGNQFDSSMAGHTITIGGTNYTVVAWVSAIKLQISAAVGLGLAYTYASGARGFNLLVFDEGKLPEGQAGGATGRWFYHRNALTGTIGGFFGFFFDGINMCGLTGAEGGAAQGFNLGDFRDFYTADRQPGGADVAIESVYQSHYDDCGFPDNDKMYLEVAIDFEFAAGAAANVYVGFNNGVIPPTLTGTLAAGPRRTIGFGFGPSQFPSADDGGMLARNISVLIDAQCTGLAIIHNVYLFFYVEARLALVASTIPLDLGIPKNKECKELQLDVDAGAGTVDVAIVSDLPGNQKAVRNNIAIAPGGRGVFHYPFATIQGFLWQVVFVGRGANTFRLYAVRLLMRVIGVFIQAAESGAGFVWDSMETAIGGGDVSTLDALRFDMETSGTASVVLSTDLPGEVPTAHGTYTLATAAMARAWVTVPLPDGIEARSVRLQTTGNGNYRLYRVQVRHGHVGRYLAGATPSGANEQFRTLEFDVNSERIRMFKRIEIDLRVDTTGTGNVTMNVFTNQDGVPLAIQKTAALSTPNGRATLLVIMPAGVRGRLLRVQLTGPTPARIYKIRVWTRTVQDKDEQAAAWRWVDFPLEDSPVLPIWTDIMEAPDETANTWAWVEVPFEVTE